MLGLKPDVGGHTPTPIMTLGELERQLLYSIFARPFHKGDCKLIDDFLAREMLFSEFEPTDKVRPFAILCEALADKRSDDPDTIKFRKLIFADINLATCTVEELMKFDIEVASAKQFLLLTRPGIMGAALDVKVLTWMRQHVNKRAPFKTPPTPEYFKWELAFCKAAQKRAVSCVDLYLEIHGQKKNTVLKKTLDQHRVNPLAFNNVDNGPLPTTP